MNKTSSAPSHGTRNTILLVAGVVLGSVLSVVVVCVVFYVRRRGKSPPVSEDCQSEASSCQQDVNLMEANLSLQSKIAQGTCMLSVTLTYYYLLLRLLRYT